MYIYMYIYIYLDAVLSNRSFLRLQLDDAKKDPETYTDN